MDISKTAVAMVSVAVSNDADGNETIIGVDRNGQVYRYQWGRYALPRDKEVNGRTQYGPAYFWWAPLRMDTMKGPEPELSQ